MTAPTRERIYGLDLLKFCCLISIQTLHVWEFIFFTDDFTIPDLSIIYEPMNGLARFFSLGGQILVSIIFLLMGLNGKKTTDFLNIAVFAILGQLVLTFVFMENDFWSALEWDIYSYIFFTALGLSLMTRNLRRSWMTILVSLCFLVVPVQVWQSALPGGLFYDILSGRKTLGHTASWGLLPWFFLATLFFGIGSRLREKPGSLKTWYKFETFFWIIALVLCVPFFGFYLKTPLGPHYYDFNFNQAPWIFWSNFFPFVFLMRISFLERVQSFCSGSKFFIWLSQLMWSRHLGVTYLMALLYVGTGIAHETTFASVPYAFDLFYLGIMPAAEIAARLIMRTKSLIVPV